MLADKKLGFDTLMLHAGHTPDAQTGSRAVPIYQTTSYVYEDVDHAAGLFALERPGYIYTRLGNPTTEVLESRLTALEEGVGTLAVASGMAAILYAILNLAAAGDEIVAASTLYGGTYTLFSVRLKEQYGIHAILVDPDDLTALENAINEKTRCVYIETIGNPSINIPDIEAIAEIAHRHGLPLVADNTFGTPKLIQLKDWGVDICVHSMTKYLGGHGTSVGGAIVEYGTFDFHNPRFASFTKPDASYHDLVYADMPAPFTMKARVHLLRDSGACLSPFNAFLILQGVETLSLRVERHCRNAEKVTQYLANHPSVSWVNYPALEGDKYHDRARKYFPDGVGGIFTFGIRGGIEAGKKFIEALEIFSLLANVADAKSLVIHPASTTHAQLNQDEMKAAGVTPDMVRVSVGLEDVRDLIDDLAQALEKSQR